MNLQISTKNQVGDACNFRSRLGVRAVGAGLSLDRKLHTVLNLIFGWHVQLFLVGVGGEARVIQPELENMWCTVQLSVQLQAVLKFLTIFGTDIFKFICSGRMHVAVGCSGTSAFTIWNSTITIKRVRTRG